MRLRVLALVALLSGCPSADELDGDCPDEDLFVSALEPLTCTRTFCGAPEVQAATGSEDDGSFRFLAPDDALLAVWGPQGGYHLDLAIETTNLCPVIYMDYTLWDVTAGKTERVIEHHRRHERAFPVAEGSPVNRWWGQQQRLPCAYWPDDPRFEEPVDCGEPRDTPIEERDLVLEIQVADHNEGRVATTSLPIRVECCADGT